MTFGERLILIREKADLNQKQFATAVGITNSSMSRAEKNQQELGSAVKKVICHEFKVNPVWLETGDGDMYVVDVVAEAIIPDLVDIFESNPSILNAVRTATLKFTAHDWQKLNEFLKSLGEAQ